MELTDLPSFSLLDVLEHLPLFELCAISNTCRRLRELAVSVAKRRYRYIDYERFMYEHQNFRKARCNITFREALRFVGPHVERLRFDGNGKRAFLHLVLGMHAKNNLPFSYFPAQATSSNASSPSTPAFPWRTPTTSNCTSISPPLPWS